MERNTKAIIEALRQNLIDNRKDERHWIDKLKPWQRWVVYTLMVPVGIIVLIASYIFSHYMAYLVYSQQ